MLRKFGRLEKTDCDECCCSESCEPFMMDNTGRILNKIGK